MSKYQSAVNNADPARPCIKATVPPQMPLEVQKALSKILQKIRQTHKDVGAEFAQRALAMSKSGMSQEPILGETTPEEEHMLDEEGVPYFKIPVPDIEKN